MYVNAKPKYILIQVCCVYCEYRITEGINRELNERLNNLEKDIVREKDSSCDPEFLKQVSESSIKNNSEQLKSD